MRMPSRPLGGLLAVLVLTSAASLPAQSQADLFPSETFLFVEGNAQALMEGGEKLDLLRMLDEDEIRDFFAPMLEKTDFDLSKGVGSVIKGLGIDQYVKGRFAFGISGLGVTFKRADGESVRYHVSPSKPVSARLFHEALGMYASLMAPGGQNQAQPELILEPELMAIVEPGPALKQMWGQMLDRMGEDIEREAVTIHGRECERITFSERERVGGGRYVGISLSVYADTAGDTWTMATSPALMERALNGGHQRTLGASKAFQKVQNRVTNSDALLLAYADIESIYGMVSTLVPPIVFEEIKILGLDSLEAMGVGMSYAAGGIRESVAFTMDDEPRGVLRLLNAMPKGIGAMETAPAATAGFIAMKFDSARFLQEARALAADLAPGSENALDALLSRASREMGLDLAEDLLPALGDEIAFSVRATLPIPQVLASLKLGDEEKAARLVQFMGKAAENHGWRVREVDLRDDGPKGMSVRVSIPGGPGQTITMGMRRGHLVLSNSSIALRKHIKGMASNEAKSLANNSEVFGKVMSGLTGGERDDLVALIYADFTKVVSAGLPMIGMLGGEMDEVLDTTAMPEVSTVNKYLSGLAIGVRRDEDGISLDMFSPLGVMPAGVAGGVFAMQESQRRQAEFIARIEAQQAAERAKMDNGPFVGFRHTTEPNSRMTIQEVIPGTPGEKAGLQKGDVIQKIDEHDIINPGAFKTTMSKYRAGDRVRMIVERGEEMVVLELTLGRRGDY